MDLSCLWGVCGVEAPTWLSPLRSAVAGLAGVSVLSVLSELRPGIALNAADAMSGAEMAAAAASAAQASPEAAPAMSQREELSWLLVVVGAISVLLAHLRSGRLVRQYGDKLLSLMNVGAQQALGEAVLRGTQTWDAEGLLSALERRRLAARNLLIGVVLGYALAAATVMWLNLQTPSYTALGAVWFVVSFLMFAALSAPVVLLGVSASNFQHLFWSWFAPITWGTVAMQMALGAHTPGEPLGPLLLAMAVLLATSAAGVVLHQRWPRLMPRLLAWARRHALASLVLAGLTLFVAIVLIEASGVSWLWSVLGGALAGWLFIALCWWTLVDRTRRIVTPLLAAGYAAAIAAASVVLMQLPPLAHWSVSVLALVAAFLAGWLARNLVRSWISLAYANKVFSDAQFQVFCWMVTIAGIVVCVGTVVRTGLFSGAHNPQDITLLDPVNLWLLGVTTLALLAYWLISLHGLPPVWSNKRLLVLRVFSRGQRGERLMDELEYRWRFIGPIVLIGGKDVAERTIDPSKAADFLRGRLHHIFVPTSHELKRRVVAMDESPDPDGRYRVNEFFCFDDLWREAVHLLLDSSDAVVLDLSEFSADRLGTTYELQLLREHGALDRTVLLFSGQTDRAAVRVALGLGPEAPLPVAVVEVEQADDSARLVQTLIRRMPLQHKTRPPAASTSGPAGDDSAEPAVPVSAAWSAKP